MRKTILCAWIVLVGTLFATGAYPALQIDANFDSGSIGSYAIDDANSTINLTLRTETLTNTTDQYTYWTNFKVLDALNRTVTFRITNASLVTFLSTSGREAQMVYSCDGENWNRITSHSYSGGTYTFSQNFTCNEPQIATFFPFSYIKMQNYVNAVAGSASAWVQKTILGSSEQVRNIDLLTITNPAVPLANKKVIYIIGRQHAGETSSSHMLEGMINFLTSNDINACGLRSYYVWHIVPMLNPDGVFLGNSRATSELRDPNRDWNDPNTNSAGTNIVRAHANSVNNTSGIDMFMDWHSQMDDSSWSNFIYAPSGNTFYPYVSARTDFDRQNTGGTSCTTSSCAARGYATLRMGLLMFGLEPTPHLDSWTVESLRQQGVNFAFAINDYFNMFIGDALPSFASELGRTNCAGNCTGDTNGDNDVDGSDIAALIQNLAQAGCVQ